MPPGKQAQLTQGLAGYFKELDISSGLVRSQEIGYRRRGNSRESRLKAGGRTFIHSTNVEDLLYAKHCSKCWKYFFSLKSWKYFF